MVESIVTEGCWPATLGASVLEQLDPQRRTAVVMALIGLCLLGVTMVVLTMLGARWARGQRLSPRRELPGSSSLFRNKGRAIDAKPNATSETLPGLPAGDETSVDS